MTDGCYACEQSQGLPFKDTSSDVEILDIQYVSDPSIPRLGKLNRCNAKKIKVSNVKSLDDMPLASPSLNMSGNQGEEEGSEQLTLRGCRSFELYHEVKHCWSVRTQFSRINEPPHRWTFLAKSRDAHWFK